ncbi:putative glucan endo-1,3-beta-D-glucosidase [Helianthus annuus]|nr:putative glucan endo-1,3-beta-D-glucosidase [Helianthus annuus]
MATPTPPHLLLTLFLSLLYITSSAGTIGINYGRIANNLPNPTQVIQLLNTNGITRIKLFDTDPTVLNALSNSTISVIVALPNEHLSTAAQNQAYTDTWVQSNILPYTQTTNITAIAVGNEVFNDPNNTTSFLIPAMQNMHASLTKYNLNIKVSTPVPLTVLGNSYPPSAGSFKPELIETLIKPMLHFLRETNSYIMVNAYPFFAYAANSDKISLDYALFRDNDGYVDDQNGVVYKNLLDAQLDAVNSAMEALNFSEVKMVVTETGWPSVGDPNETGAGEENAAEYNGNLVRRVVTGGGTPLRPDDHLNVYLFALFNEDLKVGPTSERNYGLFYPDGRKVYDVPLSLTAVVNGSTVG